MKLDKLGRRNIGFSWIRARKMHLNQGKVGEFDRHLALRISNDDYAELKRRAAGEGTSVSELARTFIVWGIETEKQEQGVVA